MPAGPGPIRFGAFEVHLAAGELRKAGARVRIQDKPFQLLLLLLERPGQIVTREAVRQALWPADTFVDFDHSLGTAIAKLRTALGDSARNPLFIETVATRGYKFIAPVGTDAVEGVAPPLDAAAAAAGAIARTVADVPTVGTVQPDGLRRFTRSAGAVAAGLVAGAALLALALGLDLLGARSWLRRQTTGSVGALAVLPLDNLSNDPRQDYLVDGVTEQLITTLAQMKGVRVISRTSAMQYKHTTKRLPEIARDLDVDAIVSGSVARAGDRVRVSAQLIDARTDQHLWAQSYDRDVSDVLTLQAEIARAIGDEIRVRLASPPGAAASPHRPPPAAQEAYLRGRYHLNQGGEAELRKSLDDFNEAVAIDAGDARSYAGLASAYIALTDFYERPSAAMPRARAAAEQAVRLDDGLAEAHAALGAVRFLYDWDWRAAERELRRATDLSAASSDAHLWYGVFLGQMGRHAEAIAQMRLAEQLDPLSVAVHVNAGWVFYLARQNDQALAQLRKALDLEPNLGWIHTSIWLAYAQLGDMRQLVAGLDKPEVSKSPLDLATLAGVYAMAGKRQQAEQVLSTLERLPPTQYACPYEIATARAVLGQGDEALRWLRRAIDDRSVCIPDLKTDPRFDSLRADRRFQDLLREVGFTP